MLFNLHKSNWSNSLKLSDFTTQHQVNVDKIKEFSRLSGLYNKWIKEETKMTREEFVVHSVGKLNPQKHLQTEVEETLNANVMDCLGSMVNTVVF
jgi:26S proteasome regulatory subunit N11